MDGSSLGDRLADRPESAEEGIGIRQEVLDKDNRKGQFRPSHKSKYHEENIERLAHRQCGDHRQQDGQDPAAGLGWKSNFG